MATSRSCPPGTVLMAVLLLVTTAPRSALCETLTRALAADSSGADSAVAPSPPWISDGPTGPDGEWQLLQIPPPTTAPQHRMWASWIHDPVRSRMILFGGWNGTYALNDLWTFSPGNGLWTSVSPSGNAPAARWGQSAVYDPVRDRVLVFGGSAYGPSDRLGDIWALSLSGQPEWTQILPEGTGPSPRFVHTSVYDPSGDRMIVFGGYDGGFINDVWSLELSPAPHWVQIVPGGTAPEGRDGHVAIYEPVQNRMIVYSGWNDHVPLGDVWQLSLGDSPTWIPLEPAGAVPPPRRACGAAYDPAHQALIVFGGEEGTGYSGLNDTWALSLTGTPQWTEIQPGGGQPSPRWGVSGAFDAVGGQALFFGGVDLTDWQNEVWGISIDPSPRWRQLFGGEGLPADRWGHTLVRDVARDRMLLFGGIEYDFALDDVWELVLAGEPGWRRIFPAGNGPGGRFVHSAILDAPRDRMIVFGGAATPNTNPYLNDLWALDLTDPPTWRELHPEGIPPAGRDAHTAIFDPMRDRMIVYGGWNESLFSDVWELSLTEPLRWTQLTPAGGPPPGRRQHGAIYDPVRDAMIVFGGVDGSGSAGRNDVWALSLSGTPAWAQIFPAGSSPSPRWGVAMDFDRARDRALVFGGVDLQDWRNQVWSLSLDANPSWALLSPSGNRPLNRMHSGFVIDPDRDRAMMFGGWSGEYAFNDTWALLLDRPVPATISTVQVDTRPGSVRLRWLASEGAEVSATVQRRDQSSDWIAHGQAVSDGNGFLAFEDREVEAGGRYGYRLEIRGTYFEETWIDVPSGLELALSGFEPNPSSRRPTLAFTLPAAPRARLEILDVTGRRIWDRDVADLGPGVHRLAWGNGKPLAPGVYIVRLTLGDRRLTAKSVVLP